MKLSRLLIVLLAVILCFLCVLFPPEKHASTGVAYVGECNLTGGFITSPVTCSLPATGSNMAAGVGVSFGNNVLPPGLAITVNAVSATAVTSASGGTYPTVGLYCAALGTISGSVTVSVSWTGGSSQYIAGGAVSASGVNQSTPCNNGQYVSGGTPESIVMTSNSGDLTFTIEGNGTINASSNQTLRWSSSNAGPYYANGDVGPGTANPTHTWTGAGASFHIAGANFLNGIVTVATPTFGLAAGTYTSSLPRTSAITTATGSATICYTVDGTTTPTAGTAGTCDATGTGGGTEYSLSNGGTVTPPVGTTSYNAIGTKVGDVNSAATGNVTYTIMPLLGTINGTTVGRAAGNISTWGGSIIGYLPTNVKSVLGLSAPVMNADVFVNFSAGSSGGAVTTGNLATVTTGGNGSWGGAVTGMTYQPVSAMPAPCQAALQMRPVLVGSQLFSGPATLAFQYTTSNSAEYEATLSFTTVSTTVAVIFPFCSDILAADTAAYDAHELANTGGATTHFMFLLVLNGQLELENEPNGVTDSDIVCTSYAPSTLYYVGMLFNSVIGQKDKMIVWDANGNQLCSITGVNTVSTAEVANYIGIGSGGDGGQTAGKHFWYTYVALDYSNGIFPP